MTLDFFAAIPDSALSDEQTIRDKSIKIAQFARAFSIFRIRKIYIYWDRAGNYSKDRKLLKLILEFLDTPPYLRKSLYPMRAELQFVGLLHPLKAPHHKPQVDPVKIRVGDIRQAIVVNEQGRHFANAGLSCLIPIEGDIPKDKRITIKFISEHPKLRCKVIKWAEADDYWGYQVKEVRSLVNLLGDDSKLVVLASREGVPLGQLERELGKRLKNAENMLVVFGSPSRGLAEILKDGRNQPSEFTKYFLNFFPRQATETVRLEEAVMGCLAIMNYLTHR